MNILTKESRVLTIRPNIDAKWLELLEIYQGDLFHSPEWIEVLIATYDFDIKANVLLDEQGKAIAGLPYVCLSDIRGQRISSLPFCDFMDPLIQTMPQWDSLVKDILACGLTYKIRPLHQMIPLLDNRLNVVNHARWHGLDLTPEIDDIWAGLHNSVRTGVRKAEKNDVKIRFAETESDLRAFFNMHLGIRKNKYHLVAQPYSFFQNIWERFIVPGKGQLILAHHQNNIIAGMMFLRYRDNLYYKFSASVPERLSVNPNESIMWAGIQYAKEIGCTYLDFGLTDWEQDGLNFFKRKFAKDEKVISFLQYTPDEKHEAQDEMSRLVGELLPALTELFTDETVPETITEKAGNLLYRYFS